MESRVQPAAPMNVEESRSKRSRKPLTTNGIGSSTSGCPPSRRARYAVGQDRQGPHAGCDEEQTYAKSVSA
ncbi:hypothetical protein KP79_PYT21368 [Mizuhopecten yessoensis]|uniref:Uncharacterized protein n=1 Tax=Mizuhopecten yessoensis TaxID=6573 RepID=A0A210PMJ9_MIZYE|nr:hypothetical protein KP79_PYT21368 [Mizuhopecten yessoensis]